MAQMTLLVTMLGKTTIITIMELTIANQW